MYSTDLQGLLAGNLRSIKLTFTEMKASYSVVVHIRRSGTNEAYQPYLEYTMDGINGRAALINQYMPQWETPTSPTSEPSFEPDSSTDEPPLTSEESHE